MPCTKMPKVKIDLRIGNKHSIRCFAQRSTTHQEYNTPFIYK